MRHNLATISGGYALADFFNLPSMGFKVLLEGLVDKVIAWSV